VSDFQIALSAVAPGDQYEHSTLNHHIGVEEASKAGASLKRL
jgi:hypothetical protein